MIEILFDQGFSRDLKRFSKNHQLQSLIKQKILLFSRDPTHPSLKNHKLTGKLKGLSAFSIKLDLRVVFKQLSATQVLFIAIGSHDQVYR